MNYQEKNKTYEPQREDAALTSLTLIQLLMLALMAVCVYFQQIGLAFIMLAVAVVGVIGRIWAKVTVREFSVKIKADRSRMFPGDEITVTYQMKNEKMLPVLWTDIFQPVTKPVCMMPVDEQGKNCLRDMTQDERETYRAEEGTKIFQERCSFISGYSTVSFDTPWRAERRGLYDLQNTRIYTGDGFGMTRYRLVPSAGSQTQFVIYPRIVAVNTEMFLKNMWEGESGSKGTLEDPSVIKLTRPYENTDSLKKINWRLLARGQELTVNQYEVISPEAIHFIFDGESFNGGKPHTAAMEETLSILASLLLRLSDRDMDCGFSFPATKRLGGENIFAGEEKTGQILYRMAEYQLRDPELVWSTATSKEEKTFEPSQFREEEILESSRQIGRYYFVTFDESSAACCSLLKKMENRPVTVLTYDMLHQLREGGRTDGKTVSS